jgi:hypothetical protein
MRKFNHLVILVGLLVGLIGFASQAAAQGAPRALRGKIITSSKEIDVPTSAKGFVKKMRKQDRSMFKKNDEGRWVIHFVAFFNRPLPAEQIGVVVLDGKKEPVAVANVAGQKGQTTLSSQISVDTTETPKKKHTIQVYYPKGNKPVVLARKQIVLK